MLGPRSGPRQERSAGEGHETVCRRVVPERAARLPTGPLVDETRADAQRGAFVGERAVGPTPASCADELTTTRPDAKRIPTSAATESLVRAASTSEGLIFATGFRSTIVRFFVLLQAAQR